MKPPTERSDEFLRQYRRYGGGMSRGQFCARQGFSDQSVNRWILDIEGFKAELDAIDAEHAGSPVVGDKGEVTFDLTDEMATFLRDYREHHERKLALDQVGWTPANLMDAMKNPVFAREYGLIGQEIKMVVEDRLVSKAKEGALGHQKFYLEAEDPERYAKKIRHNVTGAVKMFTPAAMENRKAFWQERLGKALPPAPAGEVVDAEYVSSEPTN